MYGIITSNNFTKLKEKIMYAIHMKQWLWLSILYDAPLR